MANVVITGGSRGIGAAAVSLFTQRGDRVWFLYEKNHEAAQAVATSSGFPLRPTGFSCAICSRIS